MYYRYTLGCIRLQTCNVTQSFKCCIFEFLWMCELVYLRAWEKMKEVFQSFVLDLSLHISTVFQK